MDFGLWGPHSCCLLCSVLSVCVVGCGLRALGPTQLLSVWFCALCLCSGMWTTGLGAHIVAVCSVLCFVLICLFGSVVGYVLCDSCCLLILVLCVCFTLSAWFCSLCFYSGLWTEIFILSYCWAAVA